MAERRYASTVCPSCGTSLDPLPRAKKACPGCHRAIYVRSGPDGLTYLLSEQDLEAHEARWEAHHAEQERREAAAHNAEAARQVQRSLRQYAESGVMAELSAAPDACPACRALHGRRFRPAEAPPIPVPGCTNLICRCDYLPVTRWSRS
jgi:hypothetical protein